MVIENISKYVFDKVFFPKKFIIDKPGIIINRRHRKYGGIINQIRTVFYFEEIFANLQLETIKKIGREKTSEMFYNIGKDLGTRYMLITKAKKPPAFLLPTLINYIFKGLTGVGLSIAKNIEFNKNKKSLILRGKDNIICRKTKEGNIFAGIISSIFSFLIGENIEAELFCENCPHDCKLILTPENKQRYISKTNFSKSDEEYYKQNFPENIISTEKRVSFSDFIKFKKISFSSEGKVFFEGKTIIPIPIDFLSLISSNYLENHNKEILEKGLINGAKLIAKDIVKDDDPLKKKVDKLLSLLCALGWGIPTYKLNKNNLKFTFLYPPSIMGDNFLYQSLVLNGFINYIFKKSFKIENINIFHNPVMIKIQYSLA